MNVIAKFYTEREALAFIDERGLDAFVFYQPIGASYLVVLSD